MQGEESLGHQCFKLFERQAYFCRSLPGYREVGLEHSTKPALEANLLWVMPAAFFAGG